MISTVRAWKRSSWKLKDPFRRRRGRVDAFPALKVPSRTGIPLPEDDFHPSNQDVQRSIDVPIMDRFALVTPPLPCSKRAQCSGEDVVYPPKHLNRLEGVSSSLLGEVRPKNQGRRPVVALLFRRLTWRRSARGHCLLHPQPTRGRASPPPPRDPQVTGSQARKLS